MRWVLTCGCSDYKRVFREHFGCGGAPIGKVFPLGAVAGVGLCRGRKIFQKEEFRNYRCYGS